MICSLVLLCMVNSCAADGEDPYAPYSLGAPQIGKESYTIDDMNLTVYWTQVQLKQLGYYSNKSDELTGLLGNQTAEAIKKFQKDYGMPQSGIITQALIDTIAGATAGVSLVDVQTGGYYDLLPPLPKFLNPKNQNAPACMVLQIMLKKMGYYSGEINGYFDKTMENIMYKWQLEHGWEKQQVKLGMMRQMIEEYMLWGLNPEDLILNTTTVAVTNRPIATAAPTPAPISVPAFTYTGTELPDVGHAVYGRTGPSAGEFDNYGDRISAGFNDERLGVTEFKDLKVFYLVAGMHNHTATWAYIEFSYHGEKYRMYSTKLDQLGISADSVSYVAERSAGQTYAVDNTPVSFGPGVEYALSGHTLSADTTVTAYFEENGYVMIDYRLSDGGLMRGWVPRECIY